MNSEFVVLQDGNAIAHHVAEWLLELALAKQGVFALGLSGGSCLARAMAGDEALPAVHGLPVGKRLLFVDQAAAAAR
jgi:poly(3-hydroxybutyrate) depolymerase